MKLSEEELAYFCTWKNPQKPIKPHGVVTVHDFFRRTQTEKSSSLLWVFVVITIVSLFLISALTIWRIANAGGANAEGSTGRPAVEKAAGGE